MKKSAIRLEAHPAWRNPDATVEDQDDLQDTCPHPPSRYYTSPDLRFIGCCDCGKTLRHPGDDE
jgi:hypothetical protein